MNTIRELKQQERYLNMLKRKDKEIERLNNRIGKAIKRINDWDEETSTCIEDYYFKEELLEILKGSDKE